MNDNLSRRLAFLGVLIIALFAALVTRAWYLQVLVAEEFSDQAVRNHVEIVVTQPTRGRILDRHGVVLADNIRTGVVTVDRSRYAPGQIDYVLEQLSQLLDIPALVLASRLDDKQTHPLAEKVVASGLDEYGLLRVAEKSLPGVEAKWAMSRTYPQHEIGAHVVGYVGAMSQGQQERLLKAGYLPSERVGKSGIEQIFEDDLHGKQGLIAARKTVSDDSGFFYPSIGGAAVVMDLRNGDVLAMASHPTFDPNWLVGGLTTAEYQSVFENPYAPGALNNRAIQGQYSPGSVFKLVTALAGLEARLISPRAAYYDIGYFKIPDKYGCTGRCTFYNADKAPLGIVDLSSAITRSSDAYFYKVAHDLYWIRGEEQWAIQDMARLLGFANQSGVQLPFEKSGRIGGEDLKRRLFEANPEAYNPYNESSQWLPGDNINTGIGQGFVSATPVQLANAYAAFANGGTLFSPNIVERVVSRSAEQFGESVIEFNPRIQRIVEFPEGSGVVREGLHGVASKSRRGTAWRAFEGYDSRGYAVAGKTGTAQAEGRNAVLQRKKEDSAVFIAWAPQHDPRYVVAVVMEEAGFGGQAAAPVARRIFEALRAYEQRWPDPQVAFIPPQPECPEIPEALRGHKAFIGYVPEGCPWGIEVPRANTPEDVDGDGIPDLEERD